MQECVMEYKLASEKMLMSEKSKAEIVVLKCPRCGTLIKSNELKTPNGCPSCGANTPLLQEPDARDKI